MPSSARARSISSGRASHGSDGVSSAGENSSPPGSAPKYHCSAAWATKAGPTWSTASAGIRPMPIVRRFGTNPSGSTRAHSCDVVDPRSGCVHHEVAANRARRGVDRPTRGRPAQAGDPAVEVDLASPVGQLPAERRHDGGDVHVERVAVDTTGHDPLGAQCRAQLTGLVGVEQVQGASGVAHPRRGRVEVVEMVGIGGEHHQPGRDQVDVGRPVAAARQPVETRTREPSDRGRPVGGDVQRRRPSAGVVRRRRLHLEDEDVGVRREGGCHRQAGDAGTDHDNRRHQRCSAMRLTLGRITRSRRVLASACKRSLGSLQRGSASRRASASASA